MKISTFAVAASQMTDQNNAQTTRLKTQLLLLLSCMITSGLEFQLRENYTIRKKEYEGIFLDSNYTFNRDNGFAVAASFWTPN